MQGNAKFVCKKHPSFPLAQILISPVELVKCREVPVSLLKIVMRIFVTRSRGMSHMSAIFNFEFLTLITWPFKMLHFDPNPISIGQLVVEINILCSLKTMKNIRNCHLLKPVTQNQYSRHPTHSP